MTDDEAVTVVSEIATLTEENLCILQELGVLLPSVKATITIVLGFCLTTDIDQLQHLYDKALAAFSEVEHELSVSDVEAMVLCLTRTLTFETLRISTLPQPKLSLH